MNATLTKYYISTDSASQEIEAPDADTAAREFAEGEDAPKWIKTVADLERWINKVGGYGCMKNEDTGETLFDILS